MIARRTVLYLGISQLVCWGVSYYLIGVFGGAMLLNRGVTVNATAVAPKPNRAEGRPGAALTRIRGVFMAAMCVVET